MPVLTVDFEYDGRPILELYVSMCSADRAECRDLDIQVPPPTLVKALVDPGAGRTHVDPAALSRLIAASTSHDPIYSLSGPGAGQTDIYVVDMSIAGDRPGLIARDHPVYASPVSANLRADMLLGRDVLATCILTYDGIHRRFTLAYNPPPAST